VILLDEIEKAHPDVFNILLQIFEDGHLTDSQGKRVDFKNTVIIMTSNLGAREIQKNTPMGFKKIDTEDLSYDEIKEKVMSALKRVFRPEFLNRVDEVVVFHKLSQKQVFNIMDLMMSRVAQALELQGIMMEVKKTAKNLLLEKGFDPAMGARPMRRAIQNLVEDPISEKIIAGDVKAGQVVVVKAKDHNMQFEIKKLTSPSSVIKV